MDNTQAREYRKGMNVAFLYLLMLVAVTAGSGDKMCVLTQADFRAAGLVVNAKPDVNVQDDGASAYCVYSGKSGATGGAELDVFYPAGGSAADVAQTFKTVVASDPGARYDPMKLAAADESIVSLNVPQSGYKPFASDVVRRGDLVFTISLPSSRSAKAQLARLSAIVLQRLPR